MEPTQHMHPFHADVIVALMQEPSVTVDGIQQALIEAGCAYLSRAHAGNLARGRDPTAEEWNAIVDWVLGEPDKPQAYRDGQAQLARAFARASGLAVVAPGMSADEVNEVVAAVTLTQLTSNLAAATALSTSADSDGGAAVTQKERRALLEQAAAVKRQAAEVEAHHAHRIAQPTPGEKGDR